MFHQGWCVQFELLLVNDEKAHSDSEYQYVATDSKKTDSKKTMSRKRCLMTYERYYIRSTPIAVPTFGYLVPPGPVNMSRARVSY